MELNVKPWENSTIQAILSVTGGLIETLEPRDEGEIQCKLENLKITLVKQ